MLLRKGKKGLDDIYVVGGGPSLKGFDWFLLKDVTTIAVNMAAMKVPQPDYVLTADSYFTKLAVRKRFWGVEGFFSVLVMGKDHPRYWKIRDFAALWDHRITPVRFDGRIGFTEGRFCTGQNSGFCGMQLAVVLGAKIVHLLGMDFHTKGGHHFHTGYSTNVDALDEYLGHFHTAVLLLKMQGVEVVSHSPTSRLNDWIRYEPMEGNRSE
jgi:hypothetical protein